MMKNGENRREGVDYSQGSLWEDHWVKCAKHLGQWDVLTEIAKSVPHPDLLLVSDEVIIFDPSGICLEGL